MLWVEKFQVTWCVEPIELLHSETMLLDASSGGENSKHFLAKLVLEALIHARMGLLQSE